MTELANAFFGLIPAMLSGAEAWWSSLPAGELVGPVPILLFCFAVLTGIMGGRLTIMLGAVIWAALGVCLIAIQPPEAKLFVTIATVVAHGFLFVGAYTYRRHIKRLQCAARTLEARNRELQAGLDREILWRTAAET